MKMYLIVIIAACLLSSCATMKPKSKALRRTTKAVQEEIQYEHCLNAHEDWMRPWRHGWEAPKRMMRIPLTKLYIF
jgi:outer membrane PBP1 activator LpoA protein